MTIGNVSILNWLHRNDPWPSADMITAQLWQLQKLSSCCYFSALSLFCRKPPHQCWSLSSYFERQTSTEDFPWIRTISKVAIIVIQMISIYFLLCNGRMKKWRAYMCELRVVMRGDMRVMRGAWRGRDEGVISCEMSNGMGNVMGSDARWDGSSD